MTGASQNAPAVALTEVQSTHAKHAGASASAFDGDYLAGRDSVLEPVHARFAEVFNYAGKRLATGLEGVKDDGKGGFTPTTTWDAKLGAVRAKATEND